MAFNFKQKQIEHNGCGMRRPPKTTLSINHCLIRRLTYDRLLCAVNFIKMALKTKEELEAKVKELRQDERKFSDFLRDTYGDKQCSQKIEIHTWRIKREIEIIEWVLNSELPF